MFATNRRFRACFALAAAAGLVAAGACGQSPAPEPTAPAARSPAAATAPRPAPQTAPAPQTVIISVIGTNDLHGHIAALPVLGGYLAILRDLRAKQGGGVLLLDGGDMFQGTLESNLNEGAAVVEAYNQLGYQAAAIGNHEFDFGPVGEAVTAQSAADDPVGALKARAAEAKFPFVSANMIDAESGMQVSWQNVHPGVMVVVGGVKVGIVGATTESTPFTTLPVNVRALRFAPLAKSVADAATALRQAGAELVVLTAHAGAKCEQLTDPNDLSTCKEDEMFPAVRSWQPGLVDAVVGGHTHAGVAHIVNGVPIIESFSRGAAFGRIDLEVTRRPGQPISVRATVFPPRSLCRDKKSPCEPGEYEGLPVVPDDRIAALVAARLKEADVARSRKLGVKIESAFRHAYDLESPLGNLVADLMLQANPGADVALTNGGGLRSDIPAGDLTYGQFFEVIPFDNRFATLRITGRQLRLIIEKNLAAGRGILSVAGFRVTARCKKNGLTVELRRPNGRRIRDTEELELVTSDFLASGGDGAIASLELPESAITVDNGPPLREALTALLEARGGSLSGADARLFNPAKPRLAYTGKRPLACP